MAGERLSPRALVAPGVADGVYGMAVTDEKVTGFSEVSAGGGIRTAVFKFAGTLSAGVGKTLLPNDDGADRTILSVRALSETAPSGGDEVVDVNIDDTTIFTTQANRPTIADGSTNSGKVTAIDVTTWPDGSYLSCDIDTHTAPCAELQIVVVFS